MANFSNEIKGILKNALKKLNDLESGRVNPNGLGLCAIIKYSDDGMVNLSHSDRELIDEIFAEIFRSWSGFSGRLSFPVPHPDMEPDTAYYRAGRFYDRDTQYGRNRWDLVNHLIKELTNLLANQDSQGEVV